MKPSSPGAVGIGVVIAIIFGVRSPTDSALPIVRDLKAQHPQKADYQKDAFTDEDVRNLVDHSEDNLWVLCDVHHRAKFLGIHEVSYPIWAPMNLLRGDFEDYVRQQIEASKPAKKAPKNADATDAPQGQPGTGGKSRKPRRFSCKAA